MGHLALQSCSLSPHSSPASLVFTSPHLQGLQAVGSTLHSQPLPWQRFLGLSFFPPLLPALFQQRSPQAPQCPDRAEQGCVSLPLEESSVVLIVTEGFLPSAGGWGWGWRLFSPPALSYSELFPTLFYSILSYSPRGSGLRPWGQAFCSLPADYRSPSRGKHLTIQLRLLSPLGPQLWSHPALPPPLPVPDPRSAVCTSLCPTQAGPSLSLIVK